ncbi:hypothetical protein J437_LFUL008171 [Ladona fulva]|uniref:Uncharacterized protein n=1 Tax=Ladona fulva TaxID=123851 RepID=A0A8K0KMQ6_LADFU|nr:hypothetical protein J437_LFUL008171 [Ladona fulva]
MRTNFITPKLVAAQLSVRYSVLFLKRPLRHSDIILLNFFTRCCDCSLGWQTVACFRCSEIKSLTSSDKSSSGSRHAIVDWNLKDKVQFSVVILRLQIHVISIVPVCFLNKNLIEICLFLRQAKSFEYELVIKSVFEIKIRQVTTNPDILPFKKFRHNWKSVDPDKIQCYKENLALHLTVSEIDNLLELYRTDLTKEITRDDFRELIELSVIFLGGDTHRKF